LIPAARKSRKRPASTLVGFASSVTSAPASTGHAAAIASRIAPAVAGCIREGVPPPKKTLVTVRPGAMAATWAISRESGEEARLVDALHPHMAVEVAIGAFRQAERPVDVDAKARVARGVSSMTADMQLRAAPSRSGGLAPGLESGAVSLRTLAPTMPRTLLCHPTQAASCGRRFPALTAFDVLHGESRRAADSNRGLKHALFVAARACPSNRTGSVLARAPASPSRSGCAAEAGLTRVEAACSMSSLH
jgi:hypothetical protein